ncbi:MAG: hypothetical protein AAF488_07705, partial [Planctomycetota bacterium]
MKSTLHLAWRYVTCHWLRSGILAACIALVAFLPIADGRCRRPSTPWSSAAPAGRGGRGSWPAL